MQELSDVNWLAVGVGTIAAFIVGFVWFSPIMFGKRWAEGSNVTQNAGDGLPVFAIVTQLIALFLLALVVGITATNNALLTAIIAVLTVAIFTASMGGFVKKSMFAVCVDFFYVIVAGALMIVCQGIF